jgi:hypothetical protein
MNDIAQTTTSDPAIHFAGSLSILIGVISAVGVVLLIAMFVLFATPYRDLALKVGMLNDICVALQYLLTIPVALALHRILLAHNPTLIRIATIAGITSMLLVFGLQLLLIFKVIPFERQVVWVSLAMILGVGSWLVITGMAARSIERFSNSVLMSALAVPYVGYPLWAFWLGKRLLAW